MVTIKDIARAVGVAHSTVFRALNGDPRISKATREKVLRAARELNYQPNLRRGRWPAEGALHQLRGS